MIQRLRVPVTGKSTSFVLRVTNLTPWTLAPCALALCYVLPTARYFLTENTLLAPCDSGQGWIYFDLEPEQHIGGHTHLVEEISLVLQGEGEPVVGGERGSLSKE